MSLWFDKLDIQWIHLPHIGFVFILHWWSPKFKNAITIDSINSKSFSSGETLKSLCFFFFEPKYNELTQFSYDASLLTTQHAPTALSISNYLAHWIWWERPTWIGKKTSMVQELPLQLLKASLLFFLHEKC